MKVGKCYMLFLEWETKYISYLSQWSFNSLDICYTLYIIVGGECSENTRLCKTLYRP